jgi:hypothetical protein
LFGFFAPLGTAVERRFRRSKKLECLRRTDDRVGSQQVSGGQQALYHELANVATL